MSSAVAMSDSPQGLYDVLMAARRGEPLEHTLAQIIASRACGLGAMPRWLGLGESRYSWMLANHFPYLDRRSLPVAGVPADPRRGDEMEDLYKLLMGSRSDGNESQALMAEIVVAACLGNDHLWQDLGLWSRSELSTLMNDNFAPLARRNDRDMKWKKFLYKQLCETEGIYTCRAPSCEVCNDFAACFGPEE